MIDKDGIEYVCDRFDLHYNLLFPNFNGGTYHAMCRISPDIPAGLYDVKMKNIYGTFKKTLSSKQSASVSKATYEFRAVPKISSVSSNVGSSKGQIIEIAGAGFTHNKTLVSASVGDKSCSILTSSPRKLTCLLSEGALSTPSAFVGNSGFKQYEFNLTLPEYSSLKSLTNLKSYVWNNLTTSTFNNSDLIFR